MNLVKVQGKGNEYLYRPPGHETFWISRFKKGFGRIRRSLHTIKLNEAREKRDSLMQQWLGEKPKTKTTKLVDEFWLDWSNLRKDKAPATVDSIKYTWQNLEPYFKNLYASEITEAKWEEYIVKKRLEPHPKKKNETQVDRRFFNERKWLTMFLIHLRNEGHITRLPKLRNPDPKKSDVGRVFTDEELTVLLFNAGETLSLQILLGVRMFMRISEIMFLAWNEIDFKTRVITLAAQRTKIRKGRTIPINSQVLEMLIDRKNKTPSPFVFPSPEDSSKPQHRQGHRTSWDTCKERSGVSGRFHDLRHTGLTQVFKKTNRYAEICHVAGLSIDEAERTYLHFTPEDTRFVTELLEKH